LAVRAGGRIAHLGRSPLAQEGRNLPARKQWPSFCALRVLLLIMNRPAGFPAIAAANAARARASVRQIASVS
jgi:hypothetical protein